jgi:hypothetical protein
MPLNASDFVLPGYGGNPADAMNVLSQRLWMHNMQTQRLQLAQEQKREEAGNFLRQYLNPKEYLSGGLMDPVVNAQLQRTMQHGAQMASQGADIPTILQGIAPDVQDLSNYSNKAQIIKQQLDNGVKQMKEAGIKGVDYEAAYNRAQRLAFHDVDPKSGAETIKDPSNVDVGTDYLHKAIQDYPEETTNGAGVEAYAKTLPSQKMVRDIKQADAYGNTVANRVSTTAPQGYVPDVDPATGRTIGMVPPHDVATEQGQPLMHTFVGGDGKMTQAPVRMLDENFFDNMLKTDPYMAHYYMGQVKQHWPEYEGSQPYDPSSPEAKRVARAYAYDDLKRHTPTAIEQVESNKPSAAEVQLHVFGDKYQQSYDRTLGRVDAEADEGKIPGKANTVDSMIQIAKNNPDFLHGTPAEVDGRAVLDVSSQLPKAQLKFGPGKLDAYSNVYYDPKDRTFILKNNRNPKNPVTETVTPQQLPDLLHRIAQPNAVPGGSPTASASLKKYGYKSDGSFPDVGEAPDLAGSLAAEKASTVAQGLDAWQKGGENNSKLPPTLKGINTPDGQLTSINTKWFGAKYQVNLTGPQGKEVSKRFPTREAMESYLNQSTLKAPAAAPAAPAKGGAKLTPEELQVMREQGINVTP